MARYHAATITPSKAEMVELVLNQESWQHDDSDQPVEVIGAYRFDDPDGSVGMETHIARQGRALLQVPLTYRDAPVDGAEGALAGEMNHSALGTRWVYDGLGDASYMVMFAAVSLTGQGEALGMVVRDDKWFIAPSNVRISGGGWTQERVSVDGFALVTQSPEVAEFRNDGFALTFHRHLHAGPQPEIGLRASWPEQPNPVVLSEVRPNDQGD